MPGDVGYTRSMNVRKKISDAERIEFAKQVEFFYESAHSQLAKVVGFAFLKGLATGVGVFFGGTIVVALLLWILSGLGRIPFLNDISQGAQNSIEQTH